MKRRPCSARATPSVAAAAFESGLLRDGTTRFSRDGAPVYHLAGVSSFARHTVVPANAAIAVDPDLDPAYCCLLACGVLTGVLAVTRRAGVRPGESVAVFGCGGVGLSAVQGARLVSAYPIVALDPLEQLPQVADALVDPRLNVSEPGEALAHRRDREVLRLAILELVPRDRSRDRGVRTRTHRVRRRDRPVARVLVVVDEDARAALLLPPRRRDLLRGAPLHLPCDGERAAPALRDVPAFLDSCADPFYVRVFHLAVPGPAQFTGTDVKTHKL